MSRRHAPEELDEGPGPLYAGLSTTPAVLTVEHAQAIDATIKANARAADGIARAAKKVRRLDPTALALAVDEVRRYATEHLTFLCEDVRPLCSLPDGADPRAFGHVMRAACSAGFIEPGEPMRANSSNGSYKVGWRSRVFGGAP